MKIREIYKKEEGYELSLDLSLYTVPSTILY